MTALYANAKLVKVNVGIWLMKMQARGYFPFLHAESRFNQPGNAGGGLKMSYVRFDGSDDAGIIRAALSTEDGADCTGFDRITHRRPSSMASTYPISLGMKFARKQACCNI